VCLAIGILRADSEDVAHRPIGVQVKLGDAVGVHERIQDHGAGLLGKQVHVAVGDVCAERDSEDDDLGIRRSERLGEHPDVHRRLRRVEVAKLGQRYVCLDGVEALLDCRHRGAHVRNEHLVSQKLARGVLYLGTREPGGAPCSAVVDQEELRLRELRAGDARDNLRGAARCPRPSR
jgi:hypothetical protein